MKKKLSAEEIKCAIIELQQANKTFSYLAENKATTRNYSTTKATEHMKYCQETVDKAQQLYKSAVTTEQNNLKKREKAYKEAEEAAAAKRKREDAIAAEIQRAKEEELKRTEETQRKLEEMRAKWELKEKYEENEKKVKGEKRRKTATTFDGDEAEVEAPPVVEEREEDVEENWKKRRNARNPQLSDLVKKVQEDKEKEKNKKEEDVEMALEEEDSDKDYSMEEVN